MALQHVPERAGLVVVAGSALEAQRLVVADHHRLDVLGRPHRLEDAIGESHAEQVEQNRLSQKVIHPEHLILRDQGGEQLVELACAGLIGAERLLRREDGSVGDLDVAHRLARRLGHRGWHGEVEHRAALRGVEDRAQPVGRGDVGPQVGGRIGE